MYSFWIDEMRSARVEAQRNSTNWTIAMFRDVNMHQFYRLSRRVSMIIVSVSMNKHHDICILL